MKTLLTILTVFFTVMFSSPSYAEWTEVSKNSAGTIYVDFERIRKVDGYVYSWVLADYVKPQGDKLSGKHYQQSDCKLFRWKILSFTSHTEPMGGGPGDTLSIPKRHQSWKYPSPNASEEDILKAICSR